MKTKIIKQRAIYKLLNLIDFSGDCWVVDHSLNRDNGYSRISDSGTTWYAHRLSYEAFIGPIPPKYYVCHHCDTPTCVRPSHLFIGRGGDNVRDCHQKNRRVRMPEALTATVKSEEFRKQQSERSKQWHQDRRAKGLPRPGGRPKKIIT